VPNASRKLLAQPETCGILGMGGIPRPTRALEMSSTRTASCPALATRATSALSKHF
jgi:hypothetical protein